MAKKTIPELESLKTLIGATRNLLESSINADASLTTEVHRRALIRHHNNFRSLLRKLGVSPNDEKARHYHDFIDEETEFLINNSVTAEQLELNQERQDAILKKQDFRRKLGGKIGIAEPGETPTWVSKEASGQEVANKPDWVPKRDKPIKPKKPKKPTREP